MNLKDLLAAKKAKDKEQSNAGTDCEPPHHGETCSEYIHRMADQIIAESECRKPRPNQRVWDQYDEAKAKLKGESWKPPFPEIYASEGVDDHAGDTQVAGSAAEDVGGEDPRGQISDSRDPGPDGDLMWEDDLAGGEETRGKAHFDPELDPF